MESERLTLLRSGVLTARHSLQLGGTSASPHCMTSIASVGIPQRTLADHHEALEKPPSHVCFRRVSASVCVRVCFGFLQYQTAGRTDRLCVGEGGRNIRGLNNSPCATHIYAAIHIHCNLDRWLKLVQCKSPIPLTTAPHWVVQRGHLSYLTS